MMDDLSLYQMIRDFTEDNPNTDTDVLAKKLGRRLGAATLRELAIQQIKSDMDDIRRSKARKIERDSERQAKKKAGPPSKAHKSFNESTGEWSTWGRAKVKEMERNGDVIYDYKLRDYRNTTAQEKDKQLKSQHEFEDRMEELDKRHSERIRGIFEEYKQELRIKWTQELLDSQFALGDGTRVTWGQATVEQHHQRMSMLTDNVAANLQAIKRHETAIEDIASANVECLGQVSS